MIQPSPDSFSDNFHPPGATLTGPPAVWQSLWFWVLGGLALRIALLPLNHAEYTDGQLQLEALTLRVGLYPPLFAVLASALTSLGINPETAGRLVSAIASAAAVAPLWWLTRLAGGKGNAAVWTAALYTFSPLVLRWSIRVMTDSLFFGLATGAMACWTAVLLKSRFGIANQAPEVESFRPGMLVGGPGSGLLLAAGVFLAVLATLTRWQGLALLPLGIGVLIVHGLDTRRIPWGGVLVHLLWFAVPIAGWLLGFAHGRQFSERTGTDKLATVLAYWNTAESFVLIAPYYFGYPLVALAVIQMIRNGFGVWRWPVLLLWGLYGAAILGAQSAFGSFQYRYMMPLLPLVLVPAGLLLGRLQVQDGTRHRSLLLGLGTVAFLAANSAAVLLLQRGTFGDQREASRWVAENIPAAMQVFSNERYGNFENVGSLKQSRWSGRIVRPLNSPGDIVGRPAVLILSNAYGGDGAVSSIMAAMAQTHALRPLYMAERTVVPLHDDVMVSPMLNQNPMGWVLRYHPQHFRTTILIAEPRQ